MIHFLSIFSLDYDTDLLPFFAPYYARFGFDRYLVYLHANGPVDSKIISYAENFLHKHGYETIVINGQWKERNFEKNIYEKYCSGLKGTDHLVRADADEFQDVPDNYYNIIARHDIITGLHVDRWSKKLSVAQDNTPLSNQYPIKGDFENDNNFINRFPFKRNKILAARADIPVMFNGSHGIIGNLELYKTVGPFYVHHYKYRRCLINKMCDRPYFTAPYISQYMRFFGIGYNKKYQARISGNLPSGVDL